MVKPSKRAALQESEAGSPPPPQRGRRFSRVTVLGDEHSALEVLSADSHHLLRPADIKAWALEVLTTAGVETGGLTVDHPFQNEGAQLRERVACTVLEPLEFERDPGGWLRIIKGRGYSHDDMPALAARIYELAREVELARLDPDPGARAFYATQAHATGYELGRLTMLAKVYEAERGTGGGRPPTVDHDAVRKTFSRLEGHDNRVAQTARAYGLSERQVRNIVRGAKPRGAVRNKGG